MDANLQFRQAYTQMIDCIWPSAQLQQGILQAVLLRLEPLVPVSGAGAPIHRHKGAEIT